MEAAQSAYTPSKQNSFALVPYVKLEQWTVSDESLLCIYRQMRADGSFKRVFYEGHIETAEQFLDMLKQPSNTPVVLFIDREPIGLGWLNSQSGHTAFAHFCFLSSVWGRQSLDAGKLLLKYWTSLDAGDGPIFDTLIGVIPKFNTQAICFAQRVGFTLLGEIPGMGRTGSGERLDNVVLYYARH